MSVGRLRLALPYYLTLFTAVPTLGLLCLYAWLLHSLPGRIHQQTQPGLSQLQADIQQLKRGIESRVANLQTDTASELKLSKRALSSLDKNLEQRFELFVIKFEKQLRQLGLELERAGESQGSNYLLWETISIRIPSK